VKIEQSSGSQRFDEMIMDAIKETQQKNNGNHHSTQMLQLILSLDFQLQSI
jgi:hypothetical protein